MSRCIDWRRIGSPSSIVGALLGAALYAFVFPTHGIVAHAAGIGSPTGLVVLEISGKLKVSNSGTSAVFDIEMLQGLGMRVVKTSTVWTDGGPHLFEGVLARDVLAAVGAQDARTVTVRALNDYSIEIPVSDFYEHDVILAMRMDGRQLTARDKGPLWIVYPRDGYPELQDERVDQRWVWQVKQLEVD